MTDALLITILVMFVNMFVINLTVFMMAVGDRLLEDMK